MYAICMAESSGNHLAHNLNHKTRDDSYGLFQINLYGDLAASRPSPEQLLDPNFNVDYAHKMWLNRGYLDWSTWMRGEHQKFM